MQDVWQNLGMTWAAKVGGNGLGASLTPIPAQVWFGVGVSDTTGASYPVFLYWSTNVCLNWQKKQVLSKYTEGSKSSFLHPVTHLLTFCITCKLHSCPLYMRRCIFQPQSHWGLVEPLFSLLNGRAKSLLSEAIFCFLSRVVKCLWINNS